MAPTPGSDNPSITGNQRFLLADNMYNICNIKRMWRAQWPEFSWLTIPKPADLPEGSDVSQYENSRCFQMFAPDISRVGYGEPDPANNNRCKVWSVMCPQQGIWIKKIEGTLNIEVTVTSSGGWVMEQSKNIDAQITIQPKIWFSPDTMQNNKLIKLLWVLFEYIGIPFPSSKEKAIKLHAYGVDQQDRPVKSNILTITPGLDPNYRVPSFAQHTKPDKYGQKAWTSVHLAVEIGEVISTGNEIADWFNGLVMEIFNLASGNLLQYRNVLSWNVWAIAPEEVFTPEWQMHADYWRFSLDVNHRSPEGNGRDPKYYDGTPFDAEKTAICTLIIRLLQDLKNILDGLFAEHPVIVSMINDIEAEIASIVSNNCEGESNDSSKEAVFL